MKKKITERRKEAIAKRAPISVVMFLKIKRLLSANMSKGGRTITFVIKNCYETNFTKSKSHNALRKILSSISFYAKLP